MDLAGASERPLSAVDAVAGVIRAFDREGATPDHEKEAGPALHKAVEGKRTLILLDNAKDAGTVAPIVEHRPEGCLLIITSREAMPFRITAIRLEELHPDEAVRLLQELLGPERGGSEELGRLAERCGQLPLALHSAAAVLNRQRRLRIAAYLDALSKERDRLRWLKVKGLLNLDVAAVLGFSVRQLQDDDRVLAGRWCRLAVFPTTFDAAAVAAVWKRDMDEVELGLHELEARSMVRFEPTSERYSLHDLMRDIAMLPLQSEDEAAAQERLEAARARHARHYCKVLQITHELYKAGGEGVLGGLALYDLEQRNIAAGQAWASARIEQDEAGARLAAEYANAGVHILNFRLHPREWIAWLEAQRKACIRLTNRRGESNALGNLGNAFVTLGEPSRAMEFYEQALGIAREIGDRWGEGNSLGTLGTASMILGEWRRAIESCQQALEIAREIGDRRAEAHALGNLGVAWKNLGEPRRAIQFYEQQLKIAREIGDRQGESGALGNLGIAWDVLGEPRQAIEYYEQDNNLARKIGDRMGEAITYYNWALALQALGERAEAVRRAEAALAIYEAIGAEHLVEKARALLTKLGAADERS